GGWGQLASATLPLTLNVKASCPQFESRPRRGWLGSACQRDVAFTLNVEASCPQFGSGDNWGQVAATLIELGNRHAQPDPRHPRGSTLGAALASLVPRLRGDDGFSVWP